MRMEKEWEVKGARYRAWRRRERAGVATVEEVVVVGVRCKEGRCRTGKLGEGGRANAE